MTLPTGYVPLNEYDYSHLPEDFFDDELIPLDNEFKVCYSCFRGADFYNATIDAYVCSDCIDQKLEVS